MTDRELMQEAWEALNLVLAPFPVDDQRCMRVAKKLQERLAQPEQEPVAWIYDPITERISTPQRKPLSDEEALEIARTFGAQPWPPGSCVAFARAIEAAHGIKGKT